MKYDKNRLINNIYYLARSQGLKIGELESGCEVSTGYLARLRQDQRNIAPGVDFLMKVSAWLSVSVDALLLFDFTGASSEDTKLFHFVEKLSQDTECRKLVWQRDPALNGPIPVTSSATSAHPLFDTYNVLTEEELKNRDPSDESTLSLI